MQERRGFTLLEVTASVAIGGLLLLALSQLALRSSSSSDYIISGSVSSNLMYRTLENLRSQLQRSAPDRVTVGVDAQGQDTLTFQIAGPFTGTVQWGFEDLGGVWRSGWTGVYRVNGTDLVRQSVDAAGVVQSTELLVRGIDPPAAGVAPGFDVTLASPVVTIRIRTWTSFDDGEGRSQELATSIFLKNPTT